MPKAAAKRLAFEGVLVEGHGTLAVLVPFDIVEKLGEPVKVFPRRWGYPVKARIGRKTIETAILTRGRNAGLVLDEEQAAALGLEVGQTVKVTL